MSAFLKTKFRFLVAGLVNSVFAYLSTIILFKIFGKNVSLFNLALIASFINIIFSSFVQKYFVFSSKKIILHADLQVIFYYAVLALSSSYILEALVLNFGISIWFAQFLIIVVGALFSYNYFKFIYKKS